MALASQHSDNQKSESQQGGHRSEAASPRGGGGLAAVYNAVMRDGHIAAAGRMGVDELGQALKAFPDAIQAHAEPGGLFEPLHSDIAKAREQYAPRSPLPSPGDIAKGRDVPQGREEGTVHGRAGGPAPLPGDIAKGRDVPPPQDRGTVHGKGNAQYAQMEVFMSEDVPGPVPEPTPEPMPEPAPMPEGTATQGQAPKPGGFVERLEAERGQKQGGNSGDGSSFVERLEAERGQKQGGNEGGGNARGRSLPDEQMERDRGRDR